jgi:hypothetical protein
MCRTPLSLAESPAGQLIIGEQAHIVAESPAGPRGDSTLSIIERNSYSNLILLCPNDHLIIDSNPEFYTVERLHAMKRDHEAWVTSIVSQRRLNQAWVWLCDSMAIKKDKNPKWVNSLAHLLTLFLGGSVSLYAILNSVKLVSYFLFANGGDVTLSKKFTAMLLVIPVMVGARICGVASRESLWHLKALWQRRGTPDGGENNPSEPPLPSE